MLRTVSSFHTRSASGLEVHSAIGPIHSRLRQLDHRNELRRKPTSRLLQCTAVSAQLATGHVEQKLPSRGTQRLAGVVISNSPDQQQQHGIQLLKNSAPLESAYSDSTIASSSSSSSSSMGKRPDSTATTNSASSSGAVITTSDSSSSTSSTPQAVSTRDDFGPPAWAPQPLVNFTRSTEFFARVAHIYGAYKLTQLRAAVMRAQGKSQQDITEQLWDHQHTWAGEQMYDLCISLRGFYLKAGQFIGARADFVPDQICRKLCLLQDKVPPMSPARAKQVVCSELGIDDLSEVFEWIDLQEPIGSASISQVHKAQLRRFQPDQLRHLNRREGGLSGSLTVRAGDTAWDICNSHGISLAELAASNRDVDLDRLQPGQVLKVPVVLGLEHFQQQQQQQRAAAAAGTGWLGLGRLLHPQPSASSSSSSSSSSGSAAAGVTAAGQVSEDDGALSSSSSGSSSEEWLEPGSSLLAAGSSSSSSTGGGGWPQHLDSKRRHLLQLIAPSSNNSSSGDGLRMGLFANLLGASEDESDFGSSSSSSSSLNSSSSKSKGLPDVHSPAAAAVAHAAASGHVPDGGLVAVKIQYPGALQTMTLDLVNLRSVSAFLQKTELQFDLVSAVDELQKQIHLEFEFMREARVMDTIAQHLSSLSHKVSVPRSVPGLVSQRLMVMTFIDGTPLMQLRDKVAHLPKWKRDKAARLILSQVSQAYGLMILGEGLFQADGHPGNILVQRGGRVALLDYGQSKQLEETDKLAFADLILAMNREDKVAISDALHRLHVSTSKDDPNLRADMAYGMFDTRGKVDPFDENSPIKQAAIEKFPPDMFFVLRVVQLLRGMANGMGIDDFSTADQWAPLAKQAVAKAQKKAKRRKAAASWRAQPMYDLASLAVPLKLTV